MTFVKGKKTKALNTISKQRKGQQCHLNSGLPYRPQSGQMCSLQSWLRETYGNLIFKAFEHKGTDNGMHLWLFNPNNPKTIWINLEPNKILARPPNRTPKDAKEAGRRKSLHVINLSCVNSSDNCDPMPVCYQRQGTSSKHLPIQSCFLRELVDERTVSHDGNSQLIWAGSLSGF
jgi:hypothetical protein